MARGWPSGGVLAQPGVEVVRTLEVEQGVEKSFERAEREGLNAGLLAGSQGAQAMPKQTEGDGSGFGLAALLLAFLAAQPEDLAVGHAAREVADGDPTHGADLGDGAAAEA
jgi:hypothetical protein